MNHYPPTKEEKSTKMGHKRWKLFSTVEKIYTAVGGKGIKCPDFEGIAIVC
jgi:hypothetical protein